MNLLARVKASNEYDFIVNTLSSVPDVDVEGTTVLLLTDGTTREFVDGNWEIKEQSTDAKIKESIYQFIMSVCESIHNDFVVCPLSRHYANAKMIEEKCCDENFITIKELDSKPVVKKGDFVRIKNGVGTWLTVVKGVTDTSVSVDATGLNVRCAGESECVCIQLVSFPITFLCSALDMLGYDIFMRDSKEKRQERLGNYTYTNYDPSFYNGESGYPKQLEDAVKYWQKIHI